MGAYSKAYLDEIIENQGKLFDYVAITYPNRDTEDFIRSYNAVIKALSVSFILFFVVKITIHFLFL